MSDAEERAGNSRDITSSKCWSNLTLKCYANTFVKVEGKSANGLSPIDLKGYSYSTLYCKKLCNQIRMANTVSITRRTTLC